MPKNAKKELQTDRAAQRAASPAMLFPKRARTCIVAVCAIALICFVLLPLGLDRLGSANAQPAMVSRAEAAAVTPTPAAEIDARASAVEEAAEVLPEPSPSAEIHISKYASLKLDDRYPEVTTLHSRLVSLGYLESDEPSEWYNDSTADAVALFQRTLDLKMNGIADSALQEQLFSQDAAAYEAKLGDNGADVRSMQTRLSELGYYTGKINGYFGIATEEALKAFQAKNRIEADGIYNTDDRDLILSADAKPAIDPTPVPTPTATPKPTAKPTPKPSGKPDATTPKVPEKTAAPAVTESPVDNTPIPTEADPVPIGGEPQVPSVPAEPAEPDPTPTDPPSAPVSYGSGLEAMIKCAEAQLGKRYVLGDEGPNSFDCSGLVYYCLTQAGVKTTRFSAKSFAKVSSWTEISSMSDLRRGDLLFFTDDGSGGTITHTGIYLGGGTMIDASSSNKKVVKRSCTTSYWTRNFACGRRVF